MRLNKIFGFVLLTILVSSFVFASCVEAPTRSAIGWTDSSGKHEDCMPGQKLGCGTNPNIEDVNHNYWCYSCGVRGYECYEGNVNKFSCCQNGVRVLCDTRAECEGQPTTTTTLPSCNAILGVSVSESTLNPGESFTCSVTAQRGNEGGIHCGIAKNNQWVSGCSFTGWSGNTARFSCIAPNEPATYDVIGYNFECETPDKITHITVQSQQQTCSQFCGSGYIAGCYDTKVPNTPHYDHAVCGGGTDQNRCFKRQASKWSQDTSCNGWCSCYTCEEVDMSFCEPQPPQCTPGWKCKDSTHKGYQQTDCSWSSVEFCQYGCENGQCKSPPTPTTTTTTIPPQCTQGWKCYDSTHKAYQHSDCSWTGVEYCPNGCENGYCKQGPQPPQCDIEYFCSGDWVIRRNTDCSVTQVEFCQNGCSNGECIPEPEESRVKIISTNVEPDSICESDDRTIELSARVKLEQGDNELVTVRFYVEDDHGDWDYIGSDSETLDEDETRTFEVSYYYDEGELDVGTHEVKFVATTYDDEGVEYDYLYVRDCVDHDDYDIDVKGIILDPEFPQRCQNVLVTVPIELKEAPDFPQDVYVRAYIDSRLEYSTTITYYDEESRVFKFTFDSCDYDTGTHSISVDARVDTVSDSSSKSFTISDGYIYFDYRQHCLDVEKIWTSKPIQPDEDVRVYAKITNCGTENEPGIRGSFEAFGMVMPNGMFNLPKDGSQEIMFSLHIPEDAAGSESFVVRVWSTYTSDVLVKDFVVYTGIPMIEIEPVQKVQKDKIDKVRFDVINVGQVTDTFTLELSGYASNWMTGMIPEITLEPNQRKTVEVYVNVPVDVESGDYQFTVAAEGSPRYAVTSTLRVVEGFKWPSLTGMFAFAGWLPWLLLALLLLALLLFLLWLASRMGRSGRGIPEGKIGSFFKFDDCC